MDAGDGLRAAARFGELDEVKALLAQPPAPFTSAIALASSAHPDTGNTAVHMAAANGHAGILTAILEVCSENADGGVAGRRQCRQVLSAENRPARSTALHWAALNGHLECVDVLVKAGADLAVENSYGKTPLDEAHTQGHDTVVKLLMGAVEAIESKGVDAEQFETEVVEGEVNQNE